VLRLTKSNCNISVVIATYNGSRYIEDQLKSIFCQSVLPAEIILVDDCSTDGTLELAYSIAETSPVPMRVYQNHFNLGFRDNFLKGASFALSEWISFCDQDDIWRYDKLAKLSKIIFVASDCLLVSHSSLLIDDRSTIIPGYAGLRQRSTYNTLAADSYICIPGFTITFHRDLLRLANPFKNIPDYFIHKISSKRHFLSHDKLIPLLANIFGSQHHIHEHLAYYRQHNTNLSGSHKPLSLSERLKKTKSVTPSFYYHQVKCALAITQALRACIYIGNSSRPSSPIDSVYFSRLTAGVDHYRHVAGSSLARYYLLRYHVNQNRKKRFTSILHRLLHPFTLFPRSTRKSLLSLSKDLFLYLFNFR